MRVILASLLGIGSLVAVLSGASLPGQQTAAPKCADVYFLGARGAGETDGSFGGLGPEVARIAALSRRVLEAGHIAIQSIADHYSAGSVSELKPTSFEISLFKEHPSEARRYWYSHNVTRYISGVSQGITNAVRQAQSIHSRCKRALLMLAGYSQGAIVMHQAELRLAENHDSGVLRQVAATVLVGDGTRISRTAAREFGTGARAAAGILTRLGRGSGQDVRQPATTADICDAGDAVCDFSVSRILHWSVAIRTHTSYALRHKNGTYAYKPALAQAAMWAAGMAGGRFASTAWKLVAVPVPGGRFLQLRSVACGSVSSCVAVGDYTDSSGVDEGLLATLSGSTWKAATAPLPPGGSSGGSLDSVACGSASSCVAVGAYSGGGLLETLSGTTWTPTVAPLPATAAASPSAILFSVSCASASSCAAVGQYTDTSGNIEGLLEILSGTTWTSDSAPAPAGGPSGSLESVACASATSCTAVGGRLLVTRSGTTWTATVAPLPADAFRSDSTARLAAVACGSESSCVAAGSYPGPLGFGEALLEVRSGANWRPVKAPLPPDAEPDGASLYSVACPSASSCVAVGDYSDPLSQVLVETLSGATWAPGAPLPADAAGVKDNSNVLSSVACAPTFACAAIGEYRNSSGNITGLLEIRSGTAWTAAAMPFAVGTATSATSVACPSAARCVAVGSNSPPGKSEALLSMGPG